MKVDNKFEDNAVTFKVMGAIWWRQLTKSFVLDDALLDFLKFTLFHKNKLSFLYNWRPLFISIKKPFVFQFQKDIRTLYNTRNMLRIQLLSLNPLKTTRFRWILPKGRKRLCTFVGSWKANEKEINCNTQRCFYFSASLYIAFDR